MMHKLMDQEDPKCLYCNGQCSVSLEGYKAPMGCSDDREILTCTLCKEVFTIFSIQSIEGETIYYGFSFSCQDITVFYEYKNKNFGLFSQKTKSIVDEHGDMEDISPTEVPIFEIDFSNKNKLHNKLKTYLLFS